MAKLPSKGFKVGTAALNWIFINGDGATNDMGDIPKQEYKATAVLPSAQAQPFIDQLDEFWLEYNGGKKSPAKSLGYKEEVTRDADGNKTTTKSGDVTFTFKTNTAFRQKDGSEKPVVIRVFRGGGQEITADYHAAEKKAGNDSEGIVHGTMAIYDRNAAARGITLYLSAVQFTKFVEYTGSLDVDAASEEDDGLGGDADGLDITPAAEPAGPNI